MKRLVGLACGTLATLAITALHVSELAAGGHGPSPAMDKGIVCCKGSVGLHTHTLGNGVPGDGIVGTNVEVDFLCVSQLNAASGCRFWWKYVLDEVPDILADLPEKLDGGTIDLACDTSQLPRMLVGGAAFGLDPARIYRSTITVEVDTDCDKIADVTELDIENSIDVMNP